MVYEIQHLPHPLHTRTDRRQTRQSNHPDPEHNWTKIGPAAQYLQSRRWFAGKARAIGQIRVRDTVPVTGESRLAIIDVERPTRPRLFMKYNAGGKLNDTRAVQLGTVAASIYAVVADGHNGLQVLSLITPDTVLDILAIGPSSLGS